MVATRNGSTQPVRNEKVDRLNVVINQVNTLSQQLVRLMPGQGRGSYHGGMELDSRRDLSGECGYPRDLTVQDYGNYYERSGIFKRVVDVYPEESWSVFPEVYEDEDEQVVTPFEQAYLDLDERVMLSHYLERVDKQQGIGHFGALLYGFDDGEDLERPAAQFNTDGMTRRKNSRELKLLYLRSFDECSLGVHQWNGNSQSPRYGFPEVYNVALAMPADGVYEGVASGPTWPGTNVVGRQGPGLVVKVHWTRMQHCVDNMRNGEVFGIPRGKPVFDYNLDLRKILGGSAEMYWQGAFPGFSIEQFPEVIDDSDIDLASVQTQLSNYMNRLQRWFALTGMTAKSLAPQVVSPDPQIERQLQAICMSIACPMRVFTGSEAAHLASTQDIQTWNKRIGKRQRQYLNPRLLKPTVRYLQLVGALPPSKQLLTHWVDLNALGDKDQADVSMKKSQAISQYVSGGGETVCPEFYFWTMVMNTTASQARAIVSAQKTSTTKQVWAKQQQQGAQKSAAKNGLGGKTRKAT